MGNIQEMINLDKLRDAAKAATEEAKRAWGLYVASTKTTAACAKDARDAANAAHRASMTLQGAMVENAKAKAAEAARDVAMAVAAQKARRADTPPAPKGNPKSNGSKRPPIGDGVALTSIPHPNTGPLAAAKAPARAGAVPDARKAAAGKSKPKTVSSKSSKPAKPKAAEPARDGGPGTTAVPKAAGKPVKALPASQQKFRLTNPAIVRKGEVQEYAKVAAKLKAFTKEQFAAAMVAAGKTPNQVRVKINHCLRFKVIEPVGAAA